MPPPRSTAASQTELIVVPGAYHGFDDNAPEASLSRQFTAAKMAALRRAFRGPPRAGAPSGRCPPPDRRRSRATAAKQGLLLRVLVEALPSTGHPDTARTAADGAFAFQGHAAPRHSDESTSGLLHCADDPLLHIL